VSELKEVYEFIDENFDLFLEEFREFIRKPGISTENTGIEETVSWLVAKMKESGIEDIRVFETKRHPVILGRVGKAAKRTLLVYGHYDVQPSGDRKDWKADPFAAEFVDGRIIGRGTCDMKNNLMASVHAVKSLICCKGSTPINLMFLFEGEEEIGSPHLKPFIERHKKELSACDSIVCADGAGETRGGQALLVFGLKGMLSIELLVKSSQGVEFHSGYAGITDNPAWRLVSALRCLREDDRIVIPHFYDEVKEPSSKEKTEYGLNHIALDREKLEEAVELKIKEGMSVSEALVELFYKPTLNINGLSSGYTVQGGTKTIVPDSAWARIDARLVPGQDASAVFKNVQKHLINKGFNDVHVERQNDLPAYRIEPDEKIAQVCIKATNKVVNSKTIIEPTSPGSGAMAWLPHILGKPMAFAGSGAGYMAHRPNEFITKEQYLKGIKLFATIFVDYAS
jgi:acetylornithine deacetylase/succinyl-diaminopimelate desuccinylase-like protein